MRDVLVGDYLRGRGVSASRVAQVLCGRPRPGWRCLRSWRRKSRRRSKTPGDPRSSGFPSRSAPAAPNRSRAPKASTLESLIFDAISLDYQHTLQAASGDAAEAARHQAMQENWGKYLLAVDGSIPLGQSRLFHHRRRQQPRHADGSRQGRSGDRRHRHLCGLRRHSGRATRIPRARCRSATSSRTSRSSTSRVARPFRS